MNQGTTSPDESCEQSYLREKSLAPNCNTFAYSKGNKLCISKKLRDILISKISQNQIFIIVFWFETNSFFRFIWSITNALTVIT